MFRNVITGNGEYVGGLVGKVNNAMISDVDINETHITGNSIVGGLIGASLLPSGTEITGVSIRNSIVTSNSGLIGGIAGNMQGVVLSNSYSSGNEITGSGEYVGGLVGNMNNSSTIENSYSTSKVNGTSSVGGLLGAMGGPSTVSNSYSTGIVEGNGTNTGG